MVDNFSKDIYYPASFSLTSQMHEYTKLFDYKNIATLVV